MEGRLLHTPEGVRDIYEGECRRKLDLQEKMHRVFADYGYSDIQTPTFEYFDIFSREVGTTPSRDLFKFFDREGNTLVLRPDFTPSVVRSAAKYFGDAPLPVRLCYSGNAFINESAVYQGRLKETTQMGAELFGDQSLQADAEMIALTADALKASGLEKFQVEIGQVDFFKGLLEEAGFDQEEGERLRTLISQKSFFGIEEMLRAKSIDHSLKQVFLQLTEAFGGIEKILEARNWTKNERSQAAVSRLIDLYELLKEYQCQEFVSFDLGMLSKYKYYTGIIFRAYAYGMGQPLATGGRYDNLMGYFGKDSPAIGFVVSVDHLLAGLSRQGSPTPQAPKRQLLLFEKKAEKDAARYGSEERKAHRPVILLQRDPGRELDFYRQAAEKEESLSVIYMNENGRIEDRW